MTRAAGTGTSHARGEIFFFDDTATTEIYTLSLHDALPIYHHGGLRIDRAQLLKHLDAVHLRHSEVRSEEHTSELQSQSNLVCRLLLEKKNDKREKVPGNAERGRLAPHSVHQRRGP